MQPIKTILLLLIFTLAAHANIPFQTTSNGTTTYLVDANTPFAKVITESKDDGTTIEYTYGNALLSDGEHSFLTDAIGSTRALVNSAGNITDSYAYTPYGEIASHNGTSENSFLFTGEQRDAKTDEYYLRARYYSPSMSRFVSRDSYDGRDAEPVTLNHYAYANSNPLTYADPSGHISMASLSMSMAISGVLSVGINAGISAASGGKITIGSVVTDFVIGSLEGGIFIGAQANIIKLFARFKSITKISGLTRAQARNIDKINEISHNLLVRHSLSGDLLDPGHIEKLINHRKGLTRAVNGLRGSLNNPKLKWRVKRLINKKIAIAERIIGRIDELLK